MTILKHELWQGKNTLLIWTAILAVMLGVCILIYPEMAVQMEDITDMFANMGSFSAAFGMDRISFGEFMGFFSVECGNVLGLGGAFFSALLGISALAKEEKEQTAEFLLTHPVSRKKVVFQKLSAVFVQILLLNAAVLGVTVLSILLIGETPEFKTLALLFLAYLLLQLETAALCFGISAFLNSSGPGIGLGLAALFYFLNVISNLTEHAKFLKYLTPFGYTEGADIITNGSIEPGYLSAGFLLAAAGIFAAFYQYTRKDITA